MLPTKPQTIINIFFDSIKACKKIYIEMLPLCVLFFITNASNIFFKKSPAIYYLLSLLGVFCTYYALYFVYNELTQIKVSRKIALITTTSRFLRIFAASVSFFICYFVILLIIATSTIMILGVIGRFFGNNLLFMQSAEHVYMLFIAFVAIFMFFSVLFSSLAGMDVLLKNTSVFTAVKKMLKITIKVDNIWRLVAILALPTGVMFLPHIFTYLSLITANTETLLSAFMGAIVLPLSITASIYIYNDLILRFEQQNAASATPGI